MLLPEGILFYNCQTLRESFLFFPYTLMGCPRAALRAPLCPQHPAQEAQGLNSLFLKPSSQHLLRAHTSESDCTLLRVIALVSC